jgi:hypothetical protein
MSRQQLYPTILQGPMEWQQNVLIEHLRAANVGVQDVHTLYIGTGGELLTFSNNEAYTFRVVNHPQAHLPPIPHEEIHALVFSTFLPGDDGMIPPHNANIKETLRKHLRYFEKLVRIGKHENHLVLFLLHPSLEVEKCFPLSIKSNCDHRVEQTRTHRIYDHNYQGADRHNRIHLQARQEEEEEEDQTQAEIQTDLTDIDQCADDL